MFVFLTRVGAKGRFVPNENVDQPLLQASLFFAFTFLVAFIFMLFPTSVQAQPFAPKEAVKQAQDHRVVPLKPAGLVRSVHSNHNRAVIFSYLLGVRMVATPQPSARRAQALQRKARQVVSAKPNLKSDPRKLALIQLEENWRWSR